MTAVMPADGMRLPAGSGLGTTVAAAPVIDTATPRTPTDRLIESRERIRLLMLAAAPRRKPASLHGSATIDPLRNTVATLTAKLRELPGLNVVVDAVGGWWANHPYRAVTLVAADAGRTALAPLARRHPFALVMGAAVVGALLVGIRPWRWILKPALFAGLLPQLVSRAAASVPVESWMSGIMAFVRPRHAPQSSQSRPE